MNKYYECISCHKYFRSEYADLFCYDCISRKTLKKEGEKKIMINQEEFQRRMKKELSFGAALDVYQTMIDGGWAEAQSGGFSDGGQDFWKGKIDLIFRTAENVREEMAEERQKITQAELAKMEADKKDEEKWKCPYCERVNSRYLFDTYVEELLDKGNSRQVIYCSCKAIIFGYCGEPRWAMEYTP